MWDVSRTVRGALNRARDYNFKVWGPGYARWWVESVAERARAQSAAGPRHLLFTFCDHFEPLFKTTDRALGEQRVRAWHDGYPGLASAFRDSEGRPPRHSFFFPGEEYEPGYLEALADLVRRGFGEVELHMHHDGDTAATLRPLVAGYLEKFAAHGHLTRQDGRSRFAFIHGNWCLANGRRDGRWCGVDDEIPLLFELGCYADFTFPAAPDESQSRIVNQIYWPEGDLSRRRAYDQGTRARVGQSRDDRMLMIEGPLALATKPGPRGVPVPRLEYAAITANDPATPARIRTWVRQNIHVAGRPEWVFVKVHTHGAPEPQAASLLGEGGRRLHQELAANYNDGVRWKLHYLTAREMYNVAIAAMDGRDGDPGAYRDYRLPPPPVAAA